MNKCSRPKHNSDHLNKWQDQIYNMSKQMFTQFAIIVPKWK